MAVKVGSLFSGIGGLDLGLERAGMKVVWQVENNAYCQKVLKKHWPGVPCYGDIKEIDFSTLPTIDLICGGFPCQPVSCAGKRQGDKDERWLWPEFYRAICEARPQWVLVENVPGLLSADGGRLFGGILGDLARNGYDAEWDLLPAAAVGAPHLRYRVFLVAHARLLRQKKHEEQTMGVKQPCQDVADTPEQQDLIGRPGSLGKKAKGREGSNAPVGNGSSISNPSDPRLQDGRNFTLAETGEVPELERSNWWAVEPDVGRVAHGVPSRVDRLKCLGNAVVPQVAQWLGKRIIELENQGGRAD